MKGINPILFGPAAWRVLQEVPWLFPNEILTLRDQITVTRFLDHVFRLLPCFTCRTDASELFKKIGIAGMISTNRDGYQFYTRIAIAKWVYTFHNTVNRKLGKPIYGEDWLDSVSNPREFLPSLGILILTIGYAFSNNPEPSDEEKFLFKSFMYIILPRLLRWKPEISQPLILHLRTKELSHDYVKWFAWTFEMVHALLPNDFPSYSYTSLFLGAFQSKADCSLPSKTLELGTVFQGCQ
jgi:Erv1 / Alr family